jgi:nucleoside-diphosphate-sugar epimerase
VVKKNIESVEGINETEFGFVDTLNARSCYATSKRAAETLCASYYEQYKIDFNIARPCHTYGASMQENDSRVICEFFRKANNNDTIVMKSAGAQIRSYCYTADTIKGLLYILLLGHPGEAYNIANRNSVITIRELAEKISQYAQSNIIYEKPEDKEIKGYSNIQHAILDATKLEKLGWSASYSLDKGIVRTLELISNKH